MDKHNVFGAVCDHNFLLQPFYLFSIYNNFFVFSHSAGGDSWDSSGEEGDNMFGSKAKVCSVLKSILYTNNRIP